MPHHSPSLKSWKELKEEPGSKIWWRSAAYWLGLHGLLSLLYYLRLLTYTIAYRMSPPLSVTSQENFLQACLQANLVGAFTQLRFPLAKMILDLSVTYLLLPHCWSLRKEGLVPLSLPVNHTAQPSAHSFVHSFIFIHPTKVPTKCQAAYYKQKKVSLMLTKVLLNAGTVGFLWTYHGAECETWGRHKAVEHSNLLWFEHVLQCLLCWKSDPCCNDVTFCHSWRVFQAYSV